MADTHLSISCECQISDSQEEHLRCCGFGCDSGEAQAFFSGEESSPSDGFPVEPTGIRICSLDSSSSSEDTDPEDEYRTPPEERQAVSSEEMNGEELGDPRGAGVDSCRDISVCVAESAVDLGRDSDLVFSEEKSLIDEQGSPRLGDDFGGVGGGNGGDEGLELESKENEMEVGLGLAFFDCGKGGSVRVSEGFVGEKGVFVDDSATEDVGDLGGSSVEEKEGFLKSVNGDPGDSAVKTQLGLQLQTSGTGLEENVDETNVSPLIPPHVEPAERIELPGSGNIISDEMQIERSPKKVSESHGSIQLCGHGDGNVGADNVVEKSVDPASELLPKNSSEFRKLPHWIDETVKNAIESSRRGRKRTGGVAQIQDQGNGGRVNEQEDGLCPTESEARPQDQDQCYCGKANEEDGLNCGGDGTAMEALNAKNPTEPSPNLVNLVNRMSGQHNQSEEGDKVEDILEVARRAGMKIPRPRWWGDDPWWRKDCSD